MNDNRAQRLDNEAAASAWQASGGFREEGNFLPETESVWARGRIAIRREIAAVWEACSAFEWVALSYLGFSSAVIALFAANVRHPLRLLDVEAGAAMAILLLCRVAAISEARRLAHGTSLSSRWWRFWRQWYPHLFFLFCFEELAYLVKLITPDWQDAKLIAADYWLAGVHPSVWLEQFATPFRNDAMQLVYFTYFTYLLVVGGVLYIRKDWRAYWSVMTYSMVGYSIGYVIAIFFPIESPWFSMAGWWKAPLDGGPFTAMMGLIEHYGRVQGAAFPSAHVTGATAALWGAWKYRRWLFWVMLPFFIGMCISTVWGRYHYLVDVLAGLLTGTVGYFVGSWIMRSDKAVALGRIGHNSE